MQVEKIIEYIYRPSLMWWHSWFWAAILVTKFFFEWFNDSFLEVKTELRGALLKLDVIKPENKEETFKTPLKPLNANVSSSNKENTKQMVL